MPRRIHLDPHFTTDELQKRYRAAYDPVERSHWDFLWLPAGGLTATAVAAVTGYSAYWIGQIARRYNTDSPDSMRDQRHTECAGRPDLPASQLRELGAALASPHPEGDQWCGRTVAAWLSERLGHHVGRQLGWQYLRRLGARSCAMWRPSRTRPSSCGQSTNIASGSSPSCARSGALTAGVLAPAQHRFEWRYLVGFVHPASGRTVFHLASTVSISLFEVDVAAFAHAVGASPSPTKQIVLVLDRAGWHASTHLQVPEHVHLLFLPAYSPELQPAEHLWPLTNTCLVNRHFATIEELEDAQAERCVALQAQPNLIRTATRFNCWPQQIKRRQGPKRIHSH